MRITTQMMYTQFNYNLQNSMNSIYQTDEQLASGQKLNRPSDDPAAVSDIISGKAEISAISGYQDAITNANTLLNTSNTTLDTLNSLVSSAKQIASDAETTADPSNDLTLIDNLIQSAIAAGNTMVGNRYIFSGYKSDQPAINETTGMFQGTSDRISMQVNTGTSVDVNITADEVIAFGPASAAGTNSAYMTASESFTSPTDAFSANGGSLAISLNGGTATTVTIPAGATLAGVRDAINTANMGVRSEVVDANVNGSPADYRLMLSATPADGANAISVAVTTTDGAGTGLNTLATGAGSTLTSVVSPDTTVLGVLGLLKAAISQGDKSAMQRALEDLKNVSTAILRAQSDIGTRLNMLDSEKQLLTARDTDVTNNISDKLMLSTVDTARLYALSQQQQTSLSSLRNITSGVLSTSLFDFLK